MTPLGRRIARQIEAAGPLSVADYMALCLFDPEAGYYTTRDPFGVAGDFTTAPEISQMFGELVAVWLCSAWIAAGRPLPATVAEIGPGRGTLMKDMLRTLARIAPALHGGADFALIEASPRLTQAQRETLAGHATRLSWHQGMETLALAPLFIAGNELFDALPTRQFMKAGGSWRERMVGLDERGSLVFVLGAGSLDLGLLPPDAGEAAEGTIFEAAPSRTALMEAIARRIADHGGAGLFIDYGHLEPGFGDTLQAVRRHSPDSVFEAPGEADLTTHVDFAALAAVARACGLDAHLATQGGFLLDMGLVERAGRLGAGAGEAVRARLTGEVERLAGPDAMGELFKVMAVLPRGMGVHPFSAGGAGAGRPRAAAS